MTEEFKIYPLSTLVKDVEWRKTTIPSEPDPFSHSQPDTLFTCCIEGGHRLTVLDRKTGWSGGGIRDVETGLLHADGGWWLASWMRDVRLAPEVKTLEDAIAWVIEHANNCRGISVAKDSRSRFEEWVSAPPIEKSVERFGPEGSWPGQYRDYGVQLAWESWQLATEGQK